MVSPFTVVTTLPINGTWALLGTPAAAKNAILEVLTPNATIEYALATAAADLLTQQGHFLSYREHGKGIPIPGTGICARNIGGAVLVTATAIKVLLSIDQ